MNKSAVAVVPFSLKDAPSLIERIFPSMKISAEAEKERDAKQSQTLTQLAAYWKGRKPLVLVRACILATLLPATENPSEDLRILEMLLGIDDESFIERVKRRKDYPGVLKLPYEQRLEKAYRVEEIGAEVHGHIWPTVNKHLNTNARSLEELVEQLGQRRFGRRPMVADTFAGGGSIPFEAARLGCRAYASDLNPIACMLTWGAFNIVGASASNQQELSKTQEQFRVALDQRIIDEGFEFDEEGNRAKAFLYCLEVRCPDTGWMVPLLPSRVISKAWSTIVELVPDHENKRYNFALRQDASADELKQATKGTLVDGRIVHPQNPNEQGAAFNTIRGDRKDISGRRNDLRLWDKADVRPHPDDILQERLYAVLWLKADTLSSKRPSSFFRVPTSRDLEREELLAQRVEEHLADWQATGLVPDMPIEAGQKTSEPTKTRGWTYWHHLFNPRQLHYFANFIDVSRSFPAIAALNSINLCRLLDRSSRINKWSTSNGSSGQPTNVFDDMSLKTFVTYGSYASYNLNKLLVKTSSRPVFSPGTVVCQPASDIQTGVDIGITDPPYADAVHYHEITEFFISWMRRHPPPEFMDWNWDSRRLLAIKGKGEDFREGMVKAYRAMADHMPRNGIQIVMFTHQDGKVWSDMAQIFWGAGLQVMADWYIATETTSELKKGGYVQGTHIIVLRKRAADDSGYSDEITQEVKGEVARQIEDMVGLNQSLRGQGRSENLFNDADLQMAGYAAALRVLTKYAKIDGTDMTVEALRPRAKNERTLIDDIIEYAVQVANEHLVPEGMSEQTWRKLTGTERFYLKMMDIETTGAKKVDNYQNFAKAFRVPNYGDLMASTTANGAALKTASDFGKRQMGDDEFGSSLTRAVLYALWEMGNGVDDEEVLGHLRDLSSNYLDQRSDLQAIAGYVAAKRKQIDVAESKNATILAGLIKNERLG